jgi:hypothetical protein
MRVAIGEEAQNTFDKAANFLMLLDNNILERKKTRNHEELYVF